MRVLWLTNHILPNHAHILGLLPSPRGGWMPALAEALVESGQITLGVATNVNGASWRRDVIGGVQYYTVPYLKGAVCGDRISDALIEKYQRVVSDFKPDIIHVHGTEYFHGLLTGRGHLACPTVFSVQGIIDVIQHSYYGALPLSTIWGSRTLRDWVRGDGLIEQKYRMAQRAKMERQVFSNNSAFIGRTLWDQAHTRRLNPQARYYHCEEIIRHPFYNAKWQIGHVRRYAIFASSASYPLKGFHVLVKAVSLLRKEFPAITLHSPLLRLFSNRKGVQRIWQNCRATGYTRYLNDLIRAEGVGDIIYSLPSLDAHGMSCELTKAHVFVLPSLIENSPNSLAEAMLAGTPAVASFVGGVPSMVRDCESALLFPPGEEAVLAEQIRRIFLSEPLAVELSKNARKVARTSHSKERIVRTMLDIYRKECAIADCKGLQTQEARKEQVL